MFQKAAYSKAKRVAFELFLTFKTGGANGSTSTIGFLFEFILRNVDLFPSSFLALLQFAFISTFLFRSESFKTFII